MKRHLFAMTAVVAALVAAAQPGSARPRRPLSGTPGEEPAVLRVAPDQLSFAGHIARRLARGEMAGLLASLPRVSAELTTPPPPPLTAGKVNDPAHDGVAAFGAYSQSQSSTAWCGSNVVVAYNDLGSPFEAPATRVSFVGLSRSANSGTSYSDMGFLPVNANNQTLSGDPVVACADASNFYLAAVMEDDNVFTKNVIVYRSTDGGLNWAPTATLPAALSEVTHFFSRPWIAVTPIATPMIHVTYTDFESPSSCGLDSGGDPITRVAIRYRRSTNNGVSWGPTIELDAVCADTNADGVEDATLHGSQVAVGPSHEVYVAWSRSEPLIEGTLRVRTSINDGTSFPALPSVFSNIVARVNPPGGGRELQGSIAAHNHPSLAVDRSGGPRNGTVYIAWTDGAARVTDTLFGQYAYTDVLLTRSQDRGVTWSRLPARVNTNLEPSAGYSAYTDQFLPGVAVDKTGKVGVCFYDRRRDPSNFKIDRVCASSADGGVKWKNTFKTKKPFVYAPGVDWFRGLLLSSATQQTVGTIDYDTLASDFTRAKPGFVGAYMDFSLGNEDLKANKQ